MRFVYPEAQSMSKMTAFFIDGGPGLETIASLLHYLHPLSLFCLGESPVGRLARRCFHMHCRLCVFIKGPF